MDLKELKLIYENIEKEIEKIKNEEEEKISKIKENTKKRCKPLKNKLNKIILKMGVTVNKQLTLEKDEKIEEIKEIVEIDNKPIEENMVNDYETHNTNEFYNN